jgi:hypothetical protein
VPALGRSGRGYQLCYNLKTAVNKSELSMEKPDLKDEDWSIRQAAFHHQFDVVTGTTLWITASGHEDVQNRVQELTSSVKGRVDAKAFKTQEECFKSSLAVHLLFCHWSTQGWREYLRWLEDVVEEEVSIIVS